MDGQLSRMLALSSRRQFKTQDGPSSSLAGEIVLVQRGMECGRSPLVSIARGSAGRGAADRNAERHEEAGTEAATGFKRRSGWAIIVNLVNRTRTSLRSVRAAGWAL